MGRANSRWQNKLQNYGTSARASKRKTIWMMKKEKEKEKDGV
jgi:hypothetical protein